MFAIFIHRLNAFLDGREWHCWCCCCCDFSTAAASWTSAWMMTLWQKVATNLVETTYNDWWWCRWRSFCSISHNRWLESVAAANVNVVWKGHYRHCAMQWVLEFSTLNDYCCYIFVTEVWIRQIWKSRRWPTADCCRRRNCYVLH